MKYTKTVKIIALSIFTSILITGCSIKPEALTSENIKKSVKEDLKQLNDLSKPITKAISLDAAIKRAIKNNIRNRVQLMESALAYEQIDLVYYDMLPSLTANAGYSTRNNYAASASTTFEDGKPAPIVGTPTYSISQDKMKTNADVSFSWNVLDFGLSYVRAQQQSDKYLMAKENERKVIHNIAQEVRRTYYKSVSADALLKKIVPMMNEVNIALEDSRKVNKLRLSSPMEALSYQRELLEVLRALQTLERNLMGSKIELAELMGLKPGTKFELSEKVKTNYDLPEIDLKLEEMEKIALENRPEVLESRYKERISQKETTSAILRMLPGVNINAGLSYNSSEYLLNNDWTSYGAGVSWNLLDIFKGNTFRKIAKTKIELAREQKLAISMAVLSQVHLSLAEFNQAKKEYKLAKEYLDVAEGIFKLTKVNNRLNTGSKLVFIKEKLNYILSFLRHSSSYANVQNSYGKIFASIGKYEEFKKKSFTQLKTNVEFKNTKPLAVKEKEEPKLKKPIIKAKKTITAIAAENAYIRSKANPNSDIKSVLEKDENIEVISKFYNESGYWVETKDGYIQLKSLKMNALKKKNEGLYLVKTFRPGNIRKEANWQSQIKYTIPKNRTIYVSKIVKNSGGTWYKTSDGYISSLVIKAKRK